MKNDLEVIQPTTVEKWSTRVLFENRPKRKHNKLMFILEYHRAVFYELNLDF